MDAFVAQSKQLKYLVVFPDMSTKLFKSLRAVAGATSISPPTLSRRLSTTDSAFFEAPYSNHIYWIQKWDGPRSE